jgi:catechol 2,3-dioxygenase-like lactoylglutathione lyase family enzyme
VVLAISAMRTCKEKYPDKRFFVVNTNEFEFVKLEIFPMADPVTADRSGAGVLQDHPDKAVRAGASISGGNASVYISDMDRAIKFYVTTLGLKLKARIENEWAEIDAGNGLVIGLHPAHQDTAKPGDIGAINIELAVTKCLDDVVAELRAAHVDFASEIVSWPNVRLVSVRDPDRNVIMLAQVLHH